MFNKPFFIT